jgi:hypothetical protein
MHEDIPGSLVKTERVARWAASLGAALTMLELLLLCRTGEAWLVFLTVFPPMVAMALLVGPIVRRQRRRVVMTAALAFSAHAFLGGALVMSFGGGRVEIFAIVLLGIALFFGLMFFVMSPVLVAGALLGPRTDLEAGDAMLGWAGAWLAGLQTLMLLVLRDSHGDGTSACILVAAVGLLAGVVALATFAVRAVTRRRWCARVARGDIQGWRVRETASPEELATLPPMFGSPRKVSAVLERVVMGGVLYRSGLIASSVAAVRVRGELGHGASDVGAGLVP